MTGRQVSRIPLIAECGATPGQLAFVVPDVDVAMAAWGAAGHTNGGWRIWTYSPKMVSEMTYRGVRSDHSMILAMGGSNPLIELIVPLTGPSIYHDFRDRVGTGLHHIGYYVSDLDRTTLAMEDAGYPMVQSGKGTGADGTGAYAYYDTFDELGYYLEAVIIPGVRRTPERIWPDEV